MNSWECGHASVQLVGGADEATTFGAQRVDVLQDCGAALPQVVDARLGGRPDPGLRTSEPIQIERVHSLQPPREGAENDGSLAQASGGGRSCHLTCTGHGEFAKSAIPP